MNNSEQIFEGLVKRSLIAKGSKSERNAVVLDSRGKEYVLRRQGGNAMNDPVLEGLVDKHYSFRGILHGYTLIVSEWHEML